MKRLFYNFINSMIEENKYFTDVIKKLCDKEFLMAKEHDENFENSTKCWIFCNVYVGGYVHFKRSVSYHWLCT